MNINVLRGINSERLRTQQALGEAIGWHRNKVSKLFTGKYIPNVDEAAEIADKLKLTEAEYREIFLHKASPNGDMRCSD